MRKNISLLPALSLLAGSGLAIAAPPVSINNPQYPDGETKRTRYRLTETWHDRRNAAQKAELYANTPKHGPTRQQRRAAARAAAAERKAS